MFAVCVMLGFALGYFVNNFVVGGFVALILIAACLVRAPLKADATDSTAVRGLFRKEVEERKKETDDGDPVERG